MRKFSQIIKIAVFSLGLAIFGLAPAAQAMSERDNHKQGNHRNYSKHSGNHNYSRYNKKHTYGRHSYRQSHNRHNRHSSYGYGYNNYSYGGHYSYSRHRGGDAMVLGILTGGLLFYALTANQRNAETVYVKQQSTYAQQPVQQQWTQQRVMQPRDSSCLQVREYQTTITVGDQTVPAYGQSCLQPDGTWKLGPAIPELGY